MTLSDILAYVGLALIIGAGVIGFTAMAISVGRATYQDAKGHQWGDLAFDLIIATAGCGILLVALALILYESGIK